MAKTAEFEEKTYEKYFSQELGRRGLVSFSPGQCAENSLGFDEAFRVPLHFGFLHFRHLMSIPWLRRTGIDNEIARELGRMMPNSRFNLFIQYKRPEFVSASRAKEWGFWKRNYYQYKISKEQQKTLEKLHALSEGRAAVVYASPALWKLDDLFDAHQKRNVVARSNIVTVDKLVGHGRYTYVEAGNTGKAHSDPLDVESTSFESLIEEGLKRKGLPFNQNIKNVAKLIEDAIRDDERAKTLMSQALTAFAGPLEITDALGEPKTFTYALATIEAFCDVFGVSFYVLG